MTITMRTTKTKSLVTQTIDTVITSRIPMTIIVLPGREESRRGLTGQRRRAVEGRKGVRVRAEKVASVIEILSKSM